MTTADIKPVAEQVDEVLRPPTVYGAIAAVMRLMRPIPKASKNEQGSTFWYRGIDAIQAELHPIMASVGLVIYPQKILSVEFEQVEYGSRKIVAQSCRVKVRFRMVGPDGSTAHGEMVGGAFDSGDKAISKAVTMATKSFYNYLFQIPSDDPDPDGDTYDNVQPAGRTHGRDADQTEESAAPVHPWRQWFDKAVIEGIPSLTRLLDFAKGEGQAHQQVIDAIVEAIGVAREQEQKAQAKRDPQERPAAPPMQAAGEAEKSVVPGQGDPNGDPRDLYPAIDAARVVDADPDFAPATAAQKQDAARWTTQLNNQLDKEQPSLVSVNGLITRAEAKLEETNADIWATVLNRGLRERAKRWTPDGEWIGGDSGSPEARQ